MSAGNLSKTRMIQQASLFDWRVSHNGKVEFSAPGQKVELDAAPGQVVEHLISRHSIAASRCRKVFHVVDIKVADAPMLDPTGGHQDFEGLDCLRNWDLPTPMQEIKIN